MKYILSSLIIGLTLLIVSNYGWDQCDICGNVSGVACISESSFQVCSNNAPYGNVLNCPPGTFCSNTAAICSMDVPACSYCGVCSDDLRFACISSTTFALCLGTTEPNQQFLASCKENEVCQRTTQSPNFCIPDENGAVATCSGSSPVGTSTRAPPTADEYCANRPVGRYQLTFESTCQRYVYCFLIGGVTVGEYYSCPGITLFNPALQQCVNASSFTCAH